MKQLTWQDANVNYNLNPKKQLKIYHMSSPCFCRRRLVCQPRTRSSWWRL